MSGWGLGSLWAGEPQGLAPAPGCRPLAEQLLVWRVSCCGSSSAPSPPLLPQPDSRYENNLIGNRLHFLSQRPLLALQQAGG